MAQDLLLDRDWCVAELNAGTAAEDFWATDETGVTWSIEVKNTAAITTAHRQQAMRQAGRLPWMLMSHIAGTNAWLIQRKGQNPTVWIAKPSGNCQEGIKTGLQQPNATEVRG